MESRKFVLLMLALTPGLDPRTRASLLAPADLGEILGRPQDHPDVLPEAARKALASGGVRRQAAEQIQAAGKAGVAIVGWGEPGYPALLARICDPPPALFVRGALLPVDSLACGAVVGSRQATVAGRALALFWGHEG